MNNPINHNQSERGQALGVFLLIVVVAIFVICGIALLTGDTTVLDLYNGTGEVFQSIG